MGEEAPPFTLAREKRAFVLDEFKSGRYMVVGDLTIKAVEQAIEASAAAEGKHFHLNPEAPMRKG